MSESYITVTYLPDVIEGKATKISKRVDDFDPDQLVSDFISDFALDINMQGGDLYLSFHQHRIPLDTTFQENGIFGNGEDLELFTENIPA